MFRNGCDRFLHLERFRQMCIPSGGQTFLRIFFIRQRIFPIPHITNPFLHLNAYLIYFTILTAGRQPYCSSIFSIKIPYPLVLSCTRTWVTAPTNLPFWMIGAAHPLYDSSGQGDQVRICDFQFDSPVHVVMIEMNVGDLDIIVSGGAVYGTQNLRRSLSDLLF